MNTIIKGNKFESGALGYAKSNGIGVIRILPDKQVSWVLYQSAISSPNKAFSASKPNPSLYDNVFTNLAYQSENQSFFGYSNGSTYSSWQEFLQSALKNSY